MSLSRAFAVRLGVALLALTWCGVSGAQPTNPRGDYSLSRVTNLAADAREAAERGVPLVLMFNLTGCHFCRGVLREVWQPMSKDAKPREGGAPAWSTMALYRQIDIDKTTVLLDFKGTKTTHEQFAKSLKVDFTPTVWIVDAEGKQIAESVIGISNFDFYAHYAEERIAQAYGVMQVRRSR